jgi:hypothetical protein
VGWYGCVLLRSATAAATTTAWPTSNCIAPDAVPAVLRAVRQTSSITEREDAVFFPVMKTCAHSPSSTNPAHQSRMFTAPRPVSLAVY